MMEPKTTLLLQLLSFVCVCLYTSSPTPHPSQVSPSSSPVWEQPFPGTDQSECSLHVEPPELVVRFGDPVSIICSNSQEAVLGWEGLREPVDPVMGVSMPWTEESLSNWDIEPKCYALTEVGQCALNVSLTVYQPPETVSLSFRDHGTEMDELPLLVDHLYSLHCEVEAVAPARLLTVTFYRNHRELGFQSGQSPLESPVNQSLSLDYTMSREDHGAHFYCVAKLELGPRGPQPPPVVWSQNINANVHYAPHSAVSEPQLLSVIQGQSVELNCSSEGNPTPHYSWIGPSHSHTLFSGSVFTVHSAASEHEGQYFCNASNSMGSVRRIFTVTVTVNYVPILVAVVVSGLILASVVASLVYRQFYRHSRTGHYSLRDVFRLHRHNAVPTAE